MSLDVRSLNRLEGVHDDLVAVVMRASELTSQPFVVIEGLRSIDRQKQLVAAGASQTMRSRHLTGHAVDLAAFIDLDGSGDYTKGDNIRWDWPLADAIALAMKEAAKELGIAVEWGGDWKSFKDGPHFQLAWADYPIATN